MRILWTILALAFTLTLSGQSIATEFGKNRVQYHDDQFNWSRYETENFVTYWYGKSRNIAQPIIQLAELDHDEIQKILEHTLSYKIEIIVYTDLSDLLQSNIGGEEAFTNQAKTTKVDGYKILVYFDGNHQALRERIRSGVANVYLNSILFGTNLQEIVQNALLLNLPKWFSVGMTSYSSNNWDHFVEDELRDLMSIPRYQSYDKLSDEHPRIAGHSMWNYVAQEYGGSTIANIIYLTRISRNLENSFLFILGEEYEQIEKNWASYYLNIFNSEKDFTDTEDLKVIKLKNKKGVPISNYRISPDGKYLAYVTNDRNKQRVIVRDLESGVEQTVLKTGYKNIFQEADYNYPLIAWHPTYPELTTIYEHRDVAKLKKIDIRNNTSETEDLTTNFQRVYSLSYLQNDEYILSASTDGYSDLYLYKNDNRHHTRITEDFYDDLEAQVVRYEGQTAILFRSNRPDLSLEPRKIDTILPVQNFDLFLLKGTDKDADLVRLTATEHINERQAFLSSPETVTYLHGYSGVENAYSLDLTNGKSTAVTNAERNVINHHCSPGSDLHYYNYYYKGNYINLEGSKSEVQSAVTQTGLAEENQREHSEVFIPYLPKEKETVVTEGMMFQSNFQDAADLQPIEETEEKEISASMFEKYFKDYYSNSYLDGKRIIKFKPMRASASRERFRLDNFVSKFDNTVLFEGLESYTGQDKELNTQPMGILLRGDITDLLEDYKISVGARLPTRFNGYEYFITLDNNKRLWDKRLALYRRSVTDFADDSPLANQRQKRHTFLGLYRLKYPFDVYQSIRFTPSLRFDKYFLQSTDANSFNSDFTYEKRLSLKVEYVFDSAFDVSINIRNGSLVKVFLEGINEFDLESTPDFNIDPSVALTGIVGFDARHYIPVFKNAVLALRATAATSFGDKRVVYYLGGMEQWMLASSEENIPVPGDDGSAFKVLAPQLRGFKNNIRNGNTYMLTNLEFRLPIAKFIGLDRSSISFLRNFQLTSFFDAGAAWYGTNPNSESNTLNAVSVANPEENPIIIIQARYFRDPIVYGYGFGVRSTVLGYFIKFDYGWGVETGARRDPRLYISLGMDF